MFVYLAPNLFPIGKEMFYFDSSYAIKPKTFIFLRRIPLCDTFGCYCKNRNVLFRGNIFFLKLASFRCTE